MERLFRILLVCLFVWSTLAHPHLHPRNNHPKHVQPKPAPSSSASSASDEDGRVHDEKGAGLQWEEWLGGPPPLPLWGSASLPDDPRLRNLVLLNRDDLRTKRNFGLEIPDVIMAKFDGGDGQHVRDRLNHMGRKK